MKSYITAIVICLLSTVVFARAVKIDTVKAAPDAIKSGKPVIAKTNYNDSDTTITEHSKATGIIFGPTFSRFDLGLATLIDNGSFTLSPQNQFLRYRSWKTSNVGFDVLQFGYRFTSAFKVYLSAGFDWTNIRLRENITIQRDKPVLTYTEDNIDYSKNRFSSSYLRIPLSFDFSTNEDADGKPVHFVLGPDGGFLLNGRVKQISDEKGKQKFNDTYHYATFRYGAFARVGYGAWGFFAKYYFNDMFENSPAQKGLKNFSFGLMWGFN